MSAVAYNLKKLLKWQSKKINVIAMAKMKEMKNALQTLFFYFLPSTDVCIAIM